MFKTALNILKKLNNAGFESYIIGGYSRNKYLNLKTTDIDICTSATFNDLKKFFSNTKYKNFDSMLVNFKNFNYDITTFRKEEKYLSDGKPKYQYTKDILEDIRRRDFTVNALCIDEYGNYIDFINSKKDLNNKIIKTIGNSDIKIKEDAIRVLRAIRIATELNFCLDNNLKTSIIKYGYLLKNISSAKKKYELDKIFKSNNCLYGIKLIKELKLDSYLNIKINDIKKTSYIGIWYQLNPKGYYFTKIENKQLSQIKKLLDSNFTNYDIYITNYDIIEIVSKITNLNLTKKYNQLPIKSFKDVNIDIKELINLNLKDNLTDIKNNIIINILNQSLNNDYKSIIKYLSKYMYN